MLSTLLLGAALGVAHAAPASDDKPLRLLGLSPSYQLPHWMDGSYAPMNARMHRAQRWFDLGVVGMRVGGLVAAGGLAVAVGGGVLENDPVFEVGAATAGLGVGAAMVGLGASSAGTWMGANALRDSGVAVSRANGWIAAGGYATTFVAAGSSNPAMQVVAFAGLGTVVGTGVVQVIRGRNLFEQYQYQSKKKKASVDLLPLLQPDHKGVALAGRF